MKPTAALFAACALSASSASAFNTPLAPTSHLDAALHRAANHYMADRCHVGLSITAVAGADVRFYNFGSVRRDRHQPPTPDSVYELASITKTFIGALAARALIDRRMTLDGDFRAYLPGRYPNLTENGRSITLRTLATHRSGLQRDLPDSNVLLAKPNYDRIGTQFAALNKGFGRSRTLAALHGVALRSAPGERFAYSNIGIRVIGYGLEDVYAMPLEQLLRQFIFGPLKMVETSFRPTKAMRARLAIPYGRSGNIQPYHDNSAGAAYGLYSTPRDMARYLAWHLRENDPVILLAHAAVRGTIADGDGLIWHVGKSGVTPMLWHGGGTFGETSQMVIFPADRLGLVLLANDACAGSEDELKDIALSVRAALRPTRDSAH